MDSFSDAIGSLGSLFSQENQARDDAAGSLMLSTLWTDAADALRCFPKSKATAGVDPASSMGLGQSVVLQPQRRGCHASLGSVAPRRGSHGSVDSASSAGSDGPLKDGSATVQQHLRQLRNTKTQYQTLKEQAQRLSERIIEKAAMCKQNKFAASRSGLEASEDKVLKDECELQGLKQELGRVRRAMQQCGTLESQLREANVEDRKKGVSVFSTTGPRPCRNGSFKGSFKSAA